MSYIGLLQQTGLTMTVTRQEYSSKNEYGEQITTAETKATGVPVRKQTLRQEDLINAGLPTDMATIKWLLFTPLHWPTGTLLDIRNDDRLTFNRQPTNVTYYNVVHVADATEEFHHNECIIEEIYQD